MFFPSHFGDLVQSRLALGPRTITALGATNGVAQTGVAVDRTGFNAGVVAIPVSATLTEDKTCTVAAVVETAATAAAVAWTPLALVPATVLTGGKDGTTETAVLEVDLNLLGADRFVRVSVTSTCNNAVAQNTDEQTFGAVLILGGSVNAPV